MSEPGARVRLACAGEIKVEQPADMALWFERNEGFSWPEEYWVAILILPYTAVDVDRHFVEYMPQSSEPVRFCITARTEGEHTLKIEVMDHRSGAMLQVLHATIQATP